MSVEKTKALKRLDLPVGLLMSNELNPNKMSDQEFNLLCSNMEEVGFVDPIFVRPVDDKYRVIGGHHRLEVAKLLGYDEVPCTVIDDPEFDEDQEKFQMVRMNVIRGKMSPDRFMKLYESLQGKYQEEVMADMFGFAEEEDFRRLLKNVAKDLPPELKEQFKEAQKEIKTIDDLSKVLNRLFTEHGDDLPFGYMIVDFGGKESLWLRMSAQTHKSIPEFGQVLRHNGRTADDVLGLLVQLIAQGDKSVDAVWGKVMSQTTPVEIPAGSELPTQEALAQ